MTDSDSDYDNYEDYGEEFENNILDILISTLKQDERDAKELSKDTSNNNTCKRCESKDLVSDGGYLICTNCGIVNQQILDRNPEWTHFEDGKSEGSARCGVPTNVFLPCSSLGTTIVGPGFSRLKKLHSWGQMPYKERSLSEVLQDIEGKCRKYKITKGVIVNAQYLYKKISEIKHRDGENAGKNVIIRGINRRSIIAACVFYGTLMQDTPSSLKKIADIFNLEMTQITKGIRHFDDLLQKEHVIQQIKPSDPSKFIRSYHSELNMNNAYVQLAIKISKNIAKLDLASNHQPISIAAGIILLMTKIYSLKITKKHIAEVFLISEVTINKIFNKIEKFKEIIIDDDKTEKLYQTILLEYENSES